MWNVQTYMFYIQLIFVELLYTCWLVQWRFFLIRQCRMAWNKCKICNNSPFCFYAPTTCSWWAILMTLWPSSFVVFRQQFLYTTILPKPHALDNCKQTSQKWLLVSFSKKLITLKTGCHAIQKEIIKYLVRNH